MPGFSKELFINIPDCLEKHLFCSICLNVFNNAVNSINHNCVHNFCRDCIENWIQNNRKSCPLCRQEFKRKRSYHTENEDNLIIISNNVFTRHHLINSMVNELKTKCKYESNGCQQTIEFGLLSDHIKGCEHRICEKCEFTVGKDSEAHNCVQLLKNDRNEWKEKFKELKDKTETKFKELNKELSELTLVTIARKMQTKNN